MNNNKISGKYIIVTAVAVLTSWVLHEFAHWLTGVGMGYDMVMSLNQTFPVNGGLNSNKDYQLLSAGGPTFTILQALVIFLMMKKRNNIFLYPFLLVCFYMRFFAAVISFRNPNDEARISMYMNIGKFTLPVIVSLLLFFLVYKTSQSYKLSLRFNLLTLGLIIFFSSLIIMADQFLHIRLL